jgi:16S rRNA (guanine527-N7)-methyltransferase
VDGADAQLLVDTGAAHGIVVDSAALERIGRFLDLLAVWNPRIRLTGDQDPQLLLRKHVVDCLAPAALLPRTGLVVDIGAGGGFPGLVLGCLRPDLDVLLVEPRRRPRSFLAEAVRMIPLPKGRAVEARAEDLGVDPGVTGKTSVAISRALRLDVFLPLAAPLLTPEGIAIAMQTPSLSQEAASAAARAAGLTVRERRDYTLPDGEHRRLIVFARP